jgi:CubicO group peptidase (beta-lactamase class C family)
MLIDDRRIPSVNEPLTTYFPRWRGIKRRITLREVLSQTSGLGDDVISLGTNTALQAAHEQLRHKPGEMFAYSNVATNLLSGLIREAAGEPVDAFLRHRLFAPLGISRVTWQRDDVGEAPCFAGAAMTADDLRKIGDLMLNGGAWNGRRIISKAWIDESTRSSQSMQPDYGLLWWLRYAHETRRFNAQTFTQWQRAGLPARFSSKLLPYKGKTLENAAYQSTMQRVLGPGGWTDFLRWLRKHDLPDTTIAVSGNIVQYSAEGYLGQALIIVPAKRLVIVRQISPQHYGTESDSFFDLWQYVERLQRQTLMRRAPSKSFDAEPRRELLRAPVVRAGTVEGRLVPAPVLSLGGQEVLNQAANEW